MRYRHLFFSLVALILVSLTVVVSSGAQAAKFKVLHTFTGGSDGLYPSTPLVLDRAGNLYGTTAQGGSGTGCSAGCGTVFELVPSGTRWKEKILYNFSGSSVNPTGPLTIDAKGNLYGTTGFGGDPSCPCGQAYELVRSANGWTLKILHNFVGGANDGAYPYSGMILDSAGNLYGTTSGGGVTQAGVVFKLIPNSDGSWTENVIYDSGANPRGGDVLLGGLAADAAGDLYTTAEAGGIYGQGTVFKLSPSGGSWTETTLYAFTGGDNGYGPMAGVVFDSAGNLYGTTTFGGIDLVGNVFKLTPTKGYWNISAVHNFTGGGDGGFPFGGLAMDRAGNLYGTTDLGGTYQCGTVYKLSATNGVWKETVLHNFTGGADGEFPFVGLVLDSLGNQYGVAFGGANNLGVVFEITP